MSIPEALKGAQAELSRIHTPVEKLKRIAQYARIVGAELLGTVSMIPYGIRAYTLHRSLPDAQWETPSGKSGVVSIARDVRYYAGDRNTMDIYLPADANVGSERVENNAKNRKPFVLFCHGGIWATGDKWHYSPLALRLAQAGVITAVMHYTLYPHALVPQMVEEVSRALTWTLDNAHRFGGNENRVTLAGHSAGAQLCAMALLHRASTSTEDSKHVHNVLGKGGSDGRNDSRMPWQFVGMAGVYNIAAHFEYEAARGVHELSTMARAVGGPEGFDGNSPTVIVKAALEREGRAGSSRGRNASPARQPRTPVNLQTPMYGDALAARIGFHRRSYRSTSVDCIGSESSNRRAAGTAVPAVPQISVEAVRALPPCILQSSCSDVTVPWYESADLYWSLHDCGVLVRNLVYNRVGHGEFVVGWRPRPSPVAWHATSDLPDYAADFVNIVGAEEFNTRKLLGE